MVEATGPGADGFELATGKVRCCASSDLYQEAGLFLGCGQEGARGRASGVVIPLFLGFVMPARGNRGGGSSSEPTSGSEAGVGCSAVVEG